MKNIALFPETERTHFGPATHSEDDYSFLQRSGSLVEERVRRVLEGWFERYPQDHKDEFLSRFRLNDLFKPLAAFFELYIHELLIRSEAQAITLHPEESSTKPGRPDFHVIERDGSHTYVEAKIVTGLTDAQVGALKMEQVVYDKIETVRSSHFSIGMDITGGPKQPPRAKKLVRKLQKWVDGLDYDAIVDLEKRDDHVSLPRLPHSSGDGWEIEFFPIPKDPSRQDDSVRPIGMQLFGSKPNRRVANIRNKILAKADYYDSEGPFVLAVNCLEMPFPNTKDILAIVFGDPELDLMLPQDGTWTGLPKTRRNGAWTDSRCQHLSAVLFCFKINPWSIANHDVLLVHNLWASRPYDGGLNRLTSVKVRVRNQDGQLEFHTKKGLQARDIFGLPRGWPELQ